jgi:hypothetical protein
MRFVIGSLETGSFGKARLEAWLRQNTGT